MTIQTDTVKVKMATATPTDEGTVLRLAIVDGPDVEFLLDDLATTMLGVTMSGVYQAVKARITPGDQSTYRIFGKDESNG